MNINAHNDDIAPIIMTIMKARNCSISPSSLASSLAALLVKGDKDIQDEIYELVRHGQIEYTKLGLLTLAEEKGCLICYRKYRERA